MPVLGPLREFHKLLERAPRCRRWIGALGAPGGAPGTGVRGGRRPKASEDQTRGESGKRLAAYGGFDRQPTGRIVRVRGSRTRPAKGVTHSTERRSLAGAARHPNLNRPSRRREASGSQPRRASAATSRYAMLRRLGEIALYGFGGLVLVSLVLVAFYRAAPPPVTPLMLIRLVSGHGIHKSWRSLDHISAYLVRAIMASEGRSLLPPPRVRLERDRDRLGSVPRQTWPLAGRQHHLHADREKCLPVARPRLAAKSARSLFHGAHRACLGQAADH